MNAIGMQESSENMSQVQTTTIIAGETLALHKSGALWWIDRRILVVADLHLEKGSSFAKTGTYLPPYDSKSTLTKLKELIEKFNPVRVISLGDSFHDKDAANRLSKSSLAIISRCQVGREWIWVKGNHDPLIPFNLKGEFADSIQIGNLTFVHEPSLNTVTGEVAGHLHPCARLHQNGRRIRRFCFIENSRRLILPAFGTYTGGLNVLDPAWSPYFNNSEFQVHMLGSNRLYTLPAKVLIPD